MKQKLKQFLDSEGCYFRHDPGVVDAAFARLNVCPSGIFAEFYRVYEGPFGSEFIGFSLSDVVVGNDFCITNSTQKLRAHMGFPQNYLVISDICAHAALVYDCLNDVVYNVDFEGGSDRLIEGTLEPSWETFETFLDFFFFGDDETLEADSQEEN